jgi:thioredoxin-related protein
MKKPLIYLMFACLLPAASRAQSNIVFREITLPEAFAASKNENKPIFFMGFMSWCEHCKKMKEQVFTDSAVAAFYNTRFICIHKDLEKDEGLKLRRTYSITSYPTYIFFDSTGTTLYRMGGEYTPPTFITQGLNALTPEKQFPYLKKQFEANIGDPDNCYTYLTALKAAKLELNEVMQKYLSTKTDSALLNELNWKILANGVTDINSHYFYFILHHQSEFAAIASPQRVERKIYYTVKEQLERVASADTQYYSQLRQTASAIGSPQVDTLLFATDIAYYQKAKNWNAYKNTTLGSTQKYAWNDEAKLSEIAHYYLAFITDTVALLQAARWAERANDLKETYRGYLTSARLYQKAGDKLSASKNAQKGKDFSMKYGWDYAEADTLLKELAK